MKENGITLHQFDKGDQGLILAIEKGDRAYRQKLVAMGIVPGTPFTVKRVAPLRDPIELEIRGYSLSLRRNEAVCLRVEKI